MSWVSILCFAGCLGIIVSSFRRGADVFSPARVFGFLWLLAIGLTELKLSGLQHEWTFESWVHVVIGPSAFLIGIFITYVMNLNGKLLSVETIRRTWRDQSISQSRLLIIICIMFFLYVAAYAVILFVKGVAPPLLSLRPGVARVEFEMFGIGMFLHHIVIIVFLTLIYHLMVKKHETAKWALRIISACSILTYFLLLQRFQLIMAAVMCITILYYATRHLRLTTVGLYVASGGLLFYWISTLRSGLDLFIYYLHRNSLMKFSPDYAIFTEPYMYVVMNLENFARSIEKLNHFTLGYFTFDPIFALVGLKHWVIEYFGLNYTPYLISGYNTYTAYWWYYRDFGVIGTAFIPLLLGVVIGSLYYSMRKRPSLQTLSAYSVCVFVMIISFFNNPLAFLWFVYNLFVIFLALRWVRSRQGPRVVSVNSA